MKAYLKTQFKTPDNPIQGKNRVREYLQARILNTLQRSGAMIPLAFHGGTALRFLYSIPRYSEDLDFALERTPEQYNFRTYLNAIQAEFTKEGYTVTLKVNDRKTVHSAFVRFPGLLYDLNLSPHKDEILAVKIEVDTNPPGGASLDTTIVRRHTLLRLQHHDKASLMAGKLHALLQRTYVKGRDLYDMLWYLSDPQWPAPNLRLLNNALEQTHWAGPRITPQNWQDIIREHITELNWSKVTTDLVPFLEEQWEINLINQDTFLQLLNK